MSKKKVNKEFLEHHKGQEERLKIVWKLTVAGCWFLFPIHKKNYKTLWEWIHKRIMSVLYESKNHVKDYKRVDLIN